MITLLGYARGGQPGVLSIREERARSEDKDKKGRYDEKLKTDS
jgi:hypothetical protein